MRLSLAFYFIACLALPGVTQAQLTPSPDVVRIEESWRLEIRDPDVASVAPQVTNAFAPVRQGDILFAAFSLNHHVCNEDDFGAGGLQLQLWHGDLLLAKRTTNAHCLLAQPGEVIKWKQVITLEDGVVRFSIVCGTSATFGNFGNGLSLAVATNLTTLEHYRATDSVKHSGVTYAANRVDKLALERVVLTTNDGGITTTNY